MIEYIGMCLRRSYVCNVSCIFVSKIVPGDDLEAVDVDEKESGWTPAQ